MASIKPVGQSPLLFLGRSSSILLASLVMPESAWASELPTRTQASEESQPERFEALEPVAQEAALMPVGPEAVSTIQSGVTLANNSPEHHQPEFSEGQINPHIDKLQASTSIEAREKEVFSEALVYAESPIEVPKAGGFNETISISEQSASEPVAQPVLQEDPSLEISDNLPGISDDDLEQLFENPDSPDELDWETLEESELLNPEEGRYTAAPPAIQIPNTEEKAQVSQSSPPRGETPEQDAIPTKFNVTSVKLIGNTVFPAKELAESSLSTALGKEREELDLKQVPNGSTSVEQAMDMPLEQDLCDETRHKSLPGDTFTFEGQPQEFTFEEILAISTNVAEFYKTGGQVFPPESSNVEEAVDRYSTTGAISCIPRVNSGEQEYEGPITIRIIEGVLRDIRVGPAFVEKREPVEVDPPTESTEKTEGTKSELAAQSKEASSEEITYEATRQRLRSNYVRSRIRRLLPEGTPLDVQRIKEALELLQLDPHIATVTARLSNGTQLNESILDLQVLETRPFRSTLTLDNSRPVSIGGIQRKATLSHNNLLGFGDSLSLGYVNTGGSNTLDAGYTLPLNSLDGALSFQYSRSDSRVIEEPFDDIDNDGDGGDIRSNSQSYDLTYRQPILRRITAGQSSAGERRSTFNEVALGLTGSLRDSQTSLLDIPFPLSRGANDDGELRVTALRFFQEWTRQNPDSVLAFRSQFNFGLGALGSTVNEPIPEVNEFVPDSRFFSWLGQAQWSQRLGSTLWSTRANLQLADRELLSSEQFTIGGTGSVRGYRQDAVQADNGLFASTELRVPLIKIGRNRGSIEAIPFVDYGIGWNRGSGEGGEANSLASVGLGLQWNMGNRFQARLDWGIPLISDSSAGDSLQDQGIHFSIRSNLF